jgi:hypothetical protein
MLNDLSIGEDHSQEFKDYCIEKKSEVFGPGKLDFSVQVNHILSFIILLLLYLILIFLYY